MTPNPVSIDQTAQAAASRTDQLDVAVALLVLQCAIGLLAVLGTIVIGRVTGSLPNLSRAIGFGLLGPAAALVFAIGIGRSRRWARNGTLLFEGIILVGGLLRIVVGRGSAVELVPVLIGTVLPAMILGVVLTGPSRRAFRRPTTGADQRAGFHP